MTANAVGYHLFDTAFGVCGIAWSDCGLTRLQLPEKDRASTEQRLQARSQACATAELPPQIAHAKAALEDYFRGQPESLAEIELDVGDVPPFFREIYGLTRAIGWGRTATYGELAERAGSPGSARAVGQAMARNPIPVIIPCHRILAANRKPGGFSAFGGLVTKERLLDLEGVHLGPDLPLFAGLQPAAVSSSAGNRS